MWFGVRMKKLESKKWFLDIYVCFAFLWMRFQNFNLKHKKRWRKVIKNSYKTDQNIEYDEWKDWIDGFTTSHLAMIKQCRVPVRSTDPIVISVVRDEMERLPAFLAYYRELGIKRFAFIDNNSCDNTIEWLKKQQDVDVFSCSDAFSERRKIGWSNRVMGFYGAERWFLLLDGDEFLDWIQRSEHSLSWMIHDFQKRNIFHVKALMVDMYAHNEGLQLADNFEEAFEDARYFDADTYYEKDTRYGVVMTGGIRKRVFDHEVWLTKYPLFCLREKELVLNAHLLYPIPEYEKSPCILALRHYKFILQEDVKKLKKYSKEENFCDGSKDPKVYYSSYKKNKFHFFYEDSREYSVPASLGFIRHLERI